MRGSILLSPCHTFDRRMLRQTPQPRNPAKFAQGRRSHGAGKRRGRRLPPDKIMPVCTKQFHINYFLIKITAHLPGEANSGGTGMAVPLPNGIGMGDARWRLTRPRRVAAPGTVCRAPTARNDIPVRGVRRVGMIIV
jgi:hypothetical protein